MTDSTPDKPKIIVDDDWKTQVEAEKEQLQHQKETAPNEGGEEQLPPASFPMLISTLASQALAAMGQIPDPVEGKPVIRYDLAKHMIDTLSLLEEKTKGNLTTDEATMLDDVLHQLRMLFVAIQNAAQESRPAKESKIELP